MKRALSIILCSWLFVTAFPAAGDETTRQFTTANPLVYEDAWDLWPYVFLNEHGEPEGYNIDLLKLIFKELDVPYIIKLKPTQAALNDLREGHSDLMCGMDAHFHDDYATYGKSVIQIFTHSVLHHKGVKPVIRTVEDLAWHKVVVHRGSFSHHLMIQHGWGDNAIPYNDMQEAVQFIHSEPEQQIVWNTLSLDWIIRKFHFDDLELTPVRIQHGEYKFMANNPRLLRQIDSVYTQLNAHGRLQPIQNKWFYPERKDSGIPSWIWYVIIAAIVIILVFIGYLYYYRRAERLMTKDIRRRNNRLSLILSTSRVHIWLFNVYSRTVTSFDERGKVADDIPLQDFFASLEPDDYESLLNSLREIILQEKEKQTLEVRQKDGYGKGTQNLTIALSVLRTDKNGRPSAIIGTSSDVTEETLRQQQVKDNMLRYEAVFNSTMLDIVAYDEQGCIVNMNAKASQAFGADIKNILASRITIGEVLGMPNITPENLEYTYLTQLYRTPDDPRILNRLLRRPEMYYELQLLPIRDEHGHLRAIYGTGFDVSETVKTYRRLQQDIKQLQQANNEVARYIRNIDFVLQNGGVRMIDYSPDTHLLVIHNQIGKSQLNLTQMRVLSLVSDDSKRVAQRVFNSMDSRSNATITATIKTVLRLPGKTPGKRIPLCLYLSLIPVFDEEGKIKSYFGMSRDLSEIKATEESLALEAAKAQEVETVKNAFLHNMSYQIRTPLNSVVGFAELFEHEHAKEDEDIFIKEINENSTLLLKLINDILYLSRLDARMIEIKPAPTDMAQFFESRCQTAWFNYQQPGVSYIVDNPYHHLVVNVDMQNLGIIIDKVLTNAAQYTTSGEVRASYTYTGEDLVMTFQDTGCGISPEMMEHVFDRFATSSGQGAGLGLSISHEIARQMGGRVKIHSELGQGTIVWVSIPCECSEIQRK